MNIIEIMVKTGQFITKCKGESKTAVDGSVLYWYC